MEDTKNNYRYIINIVVLLSTWIFSTKLLLTTITGYYSYNKPTKRTQFCFLFMASWTLFGLLNTLFYILSIFLFEYVMNKELVHNILQKLHEENSDHYLSKTYKNIINSFNSFRKSFGNTIENNNLYKKYTQILKQLNNIDTKVGFSNKLIKINGYLDNFFNNISNKFSKVEEEKILNRVRNNTQNQTVDNQSIDSFLNDIQLKHIGPENNGPPTKEEIDQFSEMLKTIEKLSDSIGNDNSISNNKGKKNQ